MLLKSIRLENIRSYVSEQIDFPEGSVLLSGDIGSGKTTIMLAIEFALFGIKKPFLSGSQLLRHGAKQGSVELLFSIGKDEIRIKRVLKRGKSDIKQDSGYIIINNVKAECTAQELKARILEILGYPRELLTKHKDIIYRFTVYTPQEEMKAVIFEDKELRMETLRKVFGIDKYKRIRQNLAIALKYLREKRKFLEGKAYGLEDKRKELKNSEEELKRAKEEASALEPELISLKQKAAETEKELLSCEKELAELNELKQKYSMLDTRLNEKLARKRQLDKEIERLKGSISESINERLNGLKNKINWLISKGILQEAEIKEAITKKSMAIEDLPEIKRQMQELNDKAKREENMLKEKKQEILRESYKAELAEKDAKNLIEKIASMDSCPACLQPVTGSHKQAIREKEEKKIKEASEKKEALKKRLIDIEKEIAEKRESCVKLQELREMALVLEEALRSNEEKKKALAMHIEEIGLIKKEVSIISRDRLELLKRLDAIKEKEDELNKLRIKHRLAKDDELKLSVKIAGLKSKAQAIEERCSMLAKAVSEKEDAMKKIKNISEYKHWLEEHFTGLIISIEKHVMAQLHSEFNELFIEWFSMLIDDETISVRLDDSFSVVVEQNGYESGLSSLSGGEKTSIALAYRLALNKVINNMISHIKTRNLLILDEPTDGFSEEQLDKLRDVLEQLNARQLIIVSHEPKIESFVDNIIKIRKEQHISRAYS